ncbi:MAG: hypothetical protein Q8P59_05780 [Dehalococcoidia bacterium]|nr:hypothetical protein [Dehalococcoidia bacterium]
MKAELESKEIQSRGVSLTSETEEEKQVLTNLWNQNVRLAMFSSEKDGNVEIIIATGPEREAV